MARVTDTHATAPETGSAHAGKDLKRLQRQASSRKLQRFWKSFRASRSTTAQLAQAFLDTGIPTAQV